MFTIWLIFREHPECRLRKMSGHRTDGNRGSFARADAQVKLRDVAGSPATLGVVGRNGVGRLDEGPLEILIGLGSQFAIASLATTGSDPRRGAAVAAELRGRGKRLIVPTSRSMTMANMSPTPGRLFSSCIVGVRVIRLWIRSSRVAICRERKSSNSSC